MSHQKLGLRRPGVMLAAFVLTLLPGLEADGKKKDEAPASADDLLIVDCLLPNKVRRLGRQNRYVLPRQPIRTTAADCRIRGGEYTQPDQADYTTSLAVWLPQAEGGDAEAQFYVGQIYERGLGTDPDYGKAADWYRKAADQDYSAAQVNLGHFYEEGLGVERDETAALEWYRKAAGLAADMVVLERASYDELVAAQKELSESQREVEQMRRELDELRNTRDELSEEAAASEARTAALDAAVARLETDLAARDSELAARQRRVGELETQLAAAATGGASSTAALPAAGLDFGSYHALVIGNSSYAHLPQIEGAKNDAREMAQLLEERYGFEVRLLLDADRRQIMTALNELREDLTRKDNLLVYYAGHGERDADGETAYWQPVDADARNPTNWIPNAVVAEHLDLMAAQHVFVVADSVFAGLRTRSAVARLPTGMTSEERHYHIKLLLEKRARLALASGGAGNTAESATGRGSSFADTLREVLRSNDGVLEASALYTEVNRRLLDAGRGEPKPLEFAPLRWARNDLSDFFFVPRQAG